MLMHRLLKEKREKRKRKKKFYFILFCINFCIKKYLRKFKDSHKKIIEHCKSVSLFRLSKSREFLLQMAVRIRCRLFFMRPLFLDLPVRKKV